MKTRQNVENVVGLLSLAEYVLFLSSVSLLTLCLFLSRSAQVHVTLTNDNNKVFKALQSLEPKGNIRFITGVRIAHVSLCYPSPPAPSIL